MIRAKRQTTIPKRPFEEAGLEIGTRMRVRADGAGRVVFERAEADRDFDVEIRGDPAIVPHTLAD